MRVAVYARVSTANNGQNPEMQLRELREYCKHRGLELTGEYVDAGISGAKDSRPELNRLNTDARRRRFDAVVVWKFDRFARSVSHLLRALEEFRSLGIEFVSLSEQVDTSTPTGKMRDAKESEVARNRQGGVAVYLYRSRLQLVPIANPDGQNMTGGLDEPSR